MSRWKRKVPLVEIADEFAVFAERMDSTAVPPRGTTKIPKLLADIMQTHPHYEQELQKSLKLAKSPYAKAVIQKLLENLRSLKRDDS